MLRPTQSLDVIGSMRAKEYRLRFIRPLELTPRAIELYRAIESEQSRFTFDAYLASIAKRWRDDGSAHTWMRARVIIEVFRRGERLTAAST
jgi:hypothetical protein